MPPTRLVRGWGRAGAIAFALGLAAASLPGRAAVPADTFAAERAIFLDAERALARGQRESYAALYRRLEAYPLRPYLDFEVLRPRLAKARIAEVERFLVDNAGSALAERVRRDWLETLADRGRWAKFVEHYRPGTGTTLRCLHARALGATGQREMAREEIRALWLAGESRPDECDPVFATALANGDIGRALVWQRIRLAMDANEVRLARYLERFLPEEERAVAARWRGIYADPARALDLRDGTLDPGLLETLRVGAVERAARRDPDEAASLLAALQRRFVFNPEAEERLVRRIGLAYAYRHDPKAASWLDRVSDEAAGAHGRAWRVAAALRQTDWPNVLANIARLTPAEQQEDRWRYWSARALDETGRSAEAGPIYGALARERGYYGFLAADRLDLPYALNDEPLRVTTAEVEEIAAHPAARRARELLLLRRGVDARREWRTLVRGLGDQDRLAAGRLAHLWDWHSQAIITIGSTDARDDLSLRFPILYAEAVRREANRRRLDPAWVLAVIRQESAFMDDVRSPRGAIGLMQIMPGTGRSIARKLRTRLPATRALYDPATNIRYGSAYLRMQLDRFDQHPALVTAAYNAGPTRARRWRPEGRALPADVWVETIPFTETRNYVKRVLVYTAIYEYRLGQAPTRLSRRMGVITPAS